MAERIPPHEQASATTREPGADGGARTVRPAPRRDRRGGALPSPPLPLTSFVGRERAIAAVAALIGDAAVRLVTLTGPGGVGKTRLALRVIAEVETAFAGEVGYVSLAAAKWPAQVLPTIAHALGPADRDGGADLARVMAALRGRDALLVLDNFEQVAEAGRDLVELLAACPGLTLLVTSRSPLRVAGEHVYAVPPLAISVRRRTPGPPPLRSPAAVEEAESVRLFADRARAATADFALSPDNAETVAAICERLGGLPLAIELAAGRVGILPPAALHARLTRQLPLLAGGSRDLPPRLRSMRAAIAWSHDLVGEPARWLFRRLAVAPGGLTLAAVEWVLARDPAPPDPSGEAAAALDVLSELVDAGLVQPDHRPGDEPRFTLLGPIREFAWERLDAAGEGDAAGGLLTDWLLTRAGTDDWRTSFAVGVEETGWFAAWERDLDNVRAALGWAESRGRAEPLLRLAAALFLFWWSGAHVAEGRAWLTRGFALPGDAAPPVRAFACAVASALAHRQDDAAPAEVFACRAGELWRSVGDQGGVAYADYMLAIVRYRQGDLAAASGLYAAAVDGLRAAGLPMIAAEAQVGLAQVQRDLGRLDEAAASYEEALREQEVADVGWGAALSRYGCATISQMRGDTGRALVLYRASLRYWRAVGDWGSVAACLEGIASACCATGDAQVAVRLYGAAQALREATGSPIPCRVTASYGAAYADVRSRLGATAFADGWLAGWLLTIDEAIAVADAVRPCRPAPTAHKERVGLAALSRREHEVLRLVAAGRSDREIAERLSISTRTASDHVGHILRKLGARTRVDAAAVAVRTGLA